MGLIMSIREIPPEDFSDLNLTANVPKFAPFFHYYLFNKVYKHYDDIERNHFKDLKKFKESEVHLWFLFFVLLFLYIVAHFQHETSMWEEFKKINEES